MVSELESIADPAERRRFALGAIVAIVRLGLGRYGLRANAGEPPLPTLTTGRLLGRHATPFVVSLASLTALLVAQQVLNLRERGVSADALGQAFLLAIPVVMALTIPMAVFLAVVWVFTRPGMEGVFASARRRRHGIRGLVVPVLCIAGVPAILTFVLSTEILPRTNARFSVMVDRPVPTDRTMTMAELREAARGARADSGPDAAARLTAYEVEIQKDYALAAACVVLALTGAAIALRFPRGGARLVFGASGVVFTGYFISLVVGESLADQQVMSPFVAMWMASAILIAVVLLLVWRPGQASTANESESLAVGR
jgi:lipopolysaccharide export LptBFGC system permease protein LptF